MKEKSKMEDMEIIISQFLRLGVVLSAIIIAVGFIMFLITGKSGYSDNYFPTSPLEILTGFIAFKSYAVIMIGLIVLILTPVFRVGVSILIFVREKDKLYAKITSFVFVILIISFILGKVE